MKKRIALLMSLLLLILCLGLTGCGSGSGQAADQAGSVAEVAQETGEEGAAGADAGAEAEDFLLGTWFAEECIVNGESRDPDEIFGGQFYLNFTDKGECTMAIDQKRAVVKWERTGDGVTLSGDSTYPITFPEGSETELIVQINGVDTRCVKYEE